MKDKIKLWLGFITVVAIFVIGFWYTNIEKHSNKSKVIPIPESAENVINQGNGWYSFEITINEKTITVLHHFDQSVKNDDIDDEF